MADDKKPGSRGGTLAPAAPAASDSKTVSDWQRALLPDTASGRPHANRWMHEAASALHGWAAHAHHAGQELELSRADYEAALERACALGKSGDYEPHPAATSPYAPKRG